MSTNKLELKRADLNGDPEMGYLHGEVTGTQDAFNGRERVIVEALGAISEEDKDRWTVAVEGAPGEYVAVLLPKAKPEGAA